MPFAMGDEPGDSLPINEFLDAVKRASNTTRAESLERWRLELYQEDIQDVRELKLQKAQKIASLFAKAEVGSGAQSVVALALGPGLERGFSWSAAERVGTATEAKCNKRSAPTWNTCAKYKVAKYNGDISKFDFPAGALDDWPACDVLSYKAMKEVVTKVWMLINTHPELRGGGLSPALAERLVHLLSLRYKSLEPLQKHRPRKSKGAAEGSMYVDAPV